MSGHRRISTDLFLAHLDRSVPRSKVEALLELNLDEWKGSRGSIKGYARLWGWSRDKVRKLLAEYDAHREDLENAADRVESDPTPSRHPGRHLIDTPADTPTDTQSASGATVYELRPTPESTLSPTANRHETRQQIDTFLEPEPEPEGERASPARPSARGVGAADSTRRASDREVELALAEVRPDLRHEARIRLRILAAVFRASGKRVEAEVLGVYLRQTSKISTGSFSEACQKAQAENERGFVIAHEINRVGRKLDSEARKRARGLA